MTSSVRALGGQRFVASFTPHETGIHSVQITFNGEIVPGEFCNNFPTLDCTSINSPVNVCTETLSSLSMFTFLFSFTHHS